MTVFRIFCFSPVLDLGRGAITEDFQCLGENDNLEWERKLKHKKLRAGCFPSRTLGDKDTEHRYSLPLTLFLISSISYFFADVI